MLEQKKQILIIGGSSFVARNFIKLLDNQYTIKVVSRSSTGFKDEVLYSDFFSIPDEQFSNVDVVINCAAIVHQQKEISESIYDNINHNLAVDLASKSKIQGVNTFVQLSTIAVYGNQTHITPQTKENPVTPYGKSKLKADKSLLELVNDQYRVVIFRPPMIYGGADAPGNMIRLIRFMSKGIPLPFKKIKNKRDFIHINNLIGFIQASIEKEVKGVFLVSDNSPVYIGELYKVIVNSLGKKSRAFSMPSIGYKAIKAVVPRVYDKLFGNLTIDATQAISELAYQPKQLFEKGIQEMVDGMKTKPN